MVIYRRYVLWIYLRDVISLLIVKVFNGQSNRESNETIGIFDGIEIIIKD